MIPRTLPTWQTKSWQEELSELIDSPEELFELLGIDPEHLPSVRQASQSFTLRATRSYVARIEKGNLNDPLLRQILPLGEELQEVPGFVADPLAEKQANPVAGVIHKYHGRVLLIVATQCSINCRYCFRRHFPYGDNQPNRTQWQQALDYIRANADIEEVIYSGGDPLVVGDKQLLWLTRAIAEIPHVQRLRVHTRLPITLPSRITDSCLEWLTGTRLKPVVVVHSNHSQELNDEVLAGFVQLRAAGVHLLNQAVLLRGVNDNSSALAALSRRLFDGGVMPYYLHLLDKVAGAAHFAISDEHAVSLHRSLMAQLPGYLVPKLVREIAAEPFKTPIY